MVTPQKLSNNKLHIKKDTEINLQLVQFQQDILPLPFNPRIVLVTYSLTEYLMCQSTSCTFYYVKFA